MNTAEGYEAGIAVTGTHAAIVVRRFDGKSQTVVIEHGARESVTAAEKAILYVAEMPLRCPGPRVVYLRQVPAIQRATRVHALALGAAKIRLEHSPKGDDHELVLAALDALTGEAS